MNFDNFNAPWIKTLISRFTIRDERECHGYITAFQHYSSLLDAFLSITTEHSKLKRENRLLENENQRLNYQTENALQTNPAKMVQLEQKLLQQQSQFIEVVLQRDKLKNENEALETQVKNLNLKIENLNKLLQENNKINRACMKEIQDYKNANETLLNEQTATMLTVKQLEKDKRDLTEDRTRCLSQIAVYQKEIEELKNIEADMKTQLRREKVQRDLQEAAALPILSPPSSLLNDSRRSHLSSCSIASVPDRLMASVNCSEDVNCCRFSPTGKFFASGGLDRKVWIWKVHNDKCDSQSALVGCNAGVSAVDFDSDETMVLGASSDFACRVWNLADRRLKVNLTGHSDRVVSARFFPCTPANSIVTASIDRTIKIWDVNGRRCTRTIPVTSICHDVMTCPHTNSIVSGHFDKKLRIWDMDQVGVGFTPAHEVLLPGRISGIDVSSDGNYIVACTRNDSLHTIDIRTNEVVRSFQAEDFHINSDFVKPCFSPDGHYVCCGSQNGAIFIWNTQTGDMETTLKGHDAMVICAQWNPLGHQIVSCERGKKINVWSQFGA